MKIREAQIYEWYKSSSYFGIINIESLRKEEIQDALYDGIREGYIGAIIVDEIHKAKNGSSQQGKALRILKTPVRLGLSGTPKEVQDRNELIESSKGKAVCPMWFTV